MVDDISLLGRNTSGVKLINIDSDKNISVASFAKVRESNASGSDNILSDLEKELEDEKNDDSPAIEIEEIEEEESDGLDMLRELDKDNE